LFHFALAASNADDAGENDHKVEEDIQAIRAVRTRFADPLKNLAK
jgi:hypothetical protein